VSSSVWIAALLGSSLVAADLFPLTEGNTWIYRDSRTSGTLTISVGTPISLNDQTYYPLTGYVSKQVLVRIDDQNNLVYADPDTGQEAVLTYFSPLDGSWWDAPMRICNSQGQAVDKNGDVEVRYRQGTCADAGDLSERYAANIGMVRRVTESIAGPRQYDLIHAKVGGMVLDTLPYSRFGVTVDQQPGGSSVVAKFYLQVDPSSPVTLHFASGQEYEVVLRSADGTVVWTWSADRIFVQSLHDRTVSGEWTITVAVPRPAAGAYTLQGWLTTIGDTPQFSATIPLTIGQ
jgi:hypothetical protein